MARRVVVVGVHRGNDEVDPMDVIQECGRAGRKGIDTKGDAYILIPQSKKMEMIIKYRKSPPIVSKMILGDSEGMNNLIFHVVSEVSEGNVSSASDFVEWHKRSLAAYQGCGISIDDAGEILGMLEKIRAIKKDGREYKATGLGNIACWMYMSPYDVFSWYMNFKKLFDEKRDKSTVSIAWAFANCRMFDSGYVATEDQDAAMSFTSLCRKENLEIYNTRAVYGAAFTACLGGRVFGVDATKVGLLRMDMDRIIQSVRMIDKVYARWERDSLFDRISTRFRYGVPDHLVDLCRLTGIGAVRSERLYSIGVKNRFDMVKSRELCIKALGNDDRATSIYNEAIKGGE